MNELKERLKELAQEYATLRKEKLAEFGNAQTAQTPTDAQKARGLMKEIFALASEIAKLQKQSK